MSNILDKVLKLISLTASNQEHEARSAATKACKYIREHTLHVVDLEAAVALLRKNGYHVVAPGQPQRPTTPTPSPAARDPAPPWARPPWANHPPTQQPFGGVDPFDIYMGQTLQEILRKRAGQIDEELKRRGAPAPKVEREEFDYHKMREEVAIGNRWVSSRLYHIEAMAKMMCWGCKEPFQEGETLYRHPRHESLCGPCYVHLVE